MPLPLDDSLMLQSYFDDELNAVDRARVEELIASDWTWREAASEMRETIDIVSEAARQMRAEAPQYDAAALQERIMRAIKVEPPRTDPAPDTDEPPRRR